MCFTHEHGYHCLGTQEQGYGSLEGTTVKDGNADEKAKYGTNGVITLNRDFRV